MSASGALIVNGVAFRQVRCSRTASDPCHGCVAHYNLTLCEDLAPHCRFGHVLVHASGPIIKKGGGC